MELLEREAHLEALHGALSEASGRHGCIALVSGEAGIGKTSLVTHFAGVQPSASRILWGACDSLFTPRPLGPLYDIAHPHLPDLLELLEAGSDRLTVARALLSALEESSSTSIVIIEDLHWADEATLDLLKFLGRRIQRVAVLLILTYRDDEIGPRHPLRILLGDLATAAAHRRISLRGLSQTAVREMAAGRDIDPLLLHRQTNGNPFFVTEVLANKASGIPLTVRDAVLARAARLSHSGRGVLEAAAVIGPRVEPWLLMEMTGAESTATEECMAVGILQAKASSLAFRHELARQTILEATSPQQKLVLHRLALNALRASPLGRGNLAGLAHHAEEANDHQAVLKYAPQAARQAAAASAHRQAAAQYARALRFAKDLPAADRADLLEAYASACLIVDDIARGVESRQEAVRIRRESGDRLKEGENLSLLARDLVRIGRNAQGERAIRDALEILEGLPPGPQLGIAYMHQAALRMLDRDHAEAVAWGDNAIALAERFGDIETVVEAHNAAGTALLMAGDARGRPRLERAMELARAAGLDHAVASALVNLGSGCGELYQFALADRYLAEAIAFGVERDLDYQSVYSLAWQALSHLYQGRWEQAAEVASGVSRLPGAAAISRIMALLALGRLRTRRGDPGAWNALDEAMTLADQTGTLQRIAPVRAARAEAAWLAGDRLRALEEANAAYELAVSKKHPWFTGELAFWRRQAGQEVDTPLWTAIPYALQLAGEWQKSAHEWERLNCPYEQARALAGGDKAAQLAALQIYERLGAAPAAEHLRSELRSAGVRGIPRGPRPATLENIHGLTPRELEVLSLVVQAQSNAEIAARLSLSTRTVEHHVSAILSKLGVQSRGEAIATALRADRFQKK